MNTATDNPDPYERLAALNLTLEPRKMRAEWFNPLRQSGNLMYVSGQIANNAQGVLHRGRMGDEVSIEQGQACARLAMLNILSLVHHNSEGLRHWRPFKISVAVSATHNFADVGEVVNGASLLLVDVYGPVLGAHARSGFSNVAPAGGSPVEVEAIFERYDGPPRS